jgi:hypothetical protein
MSASAFNFAVRRLVVTRSTTFPPPAHLHLANFKSLLRVRLRSFFAPSSSTGKGGSMKILTHVVLIALLLSLLSSCAYFRKENPLNLHCPSCGYIWDRTPAER